MEVISVPSQMQAWSLNHRRNGHKIGLVPTMGFLHEGHLSLVREARRQCDVVVVSIFVNPIQFGVNEDFDKYPRALEKDITLLEEEGVNAVFAPAAADMYPAGYGTFVDTAGLDDKLCGRSRPGHFRGVTTVVSKLFNICLPDVSVFGQKDAQQVMIIEKMVKDLNFPIQIIRGEIVREKDGLAMSSRNVYLSPTDRENAVVLNRSLQKAREMIAAGADDPVQVRQAVVEAIEATPNASIDYVELYGGDDLRELTRIEGRVLIALAVRFGATRLIDNLLLEV